MRISAIQTTNTGYNTQLHSKFTQNKHNVAFSGIGTVKLISEAYSALILANKAYKSFDTHKKIYEVLSNVESILKDLDANPNSRALIITSLSKIRSGQDETFGYALYELFKIKSLPTINKLKDMALTKLIYEMDDKDNMDRTAKQVLFKRLYDNGEYTNETYLTAFKNLPDSYYGKFKESIIDLCLFSIDNEDLYKYPLRLIYNRKLVDSLDPKKHWGYLKKSTQGQMKLNNTIDVFANKKLTRKHNSAYEYYCLNSNMQMDNMKLWQPYMQKVFEVNLFLSGGDSKKLASLLNIDQYLAEDIVKDYKILDMAEDIDDKATKFALYKMRIDEKFKTILPYEDSAEISREKYTALDMKHSSISNFIEKTDMAIELNDAYKENLDNLYDKYEVAYEKFNSASDTLNDEIPMWAHWDGY